MYNCDFDTWNGTDTNKISNVTAVVETLATLTNCSASVGEGCRVPPLDTATLASCQASLQAVEDKSQECYNLLTETNAVSCRSFGYFGFLSFCLICSMLI